MGYTHYWTFIEPKRGETAKIKKAYQKAIEKNGQKNLKTLVAGWGAC